MPLWFESAFSLYNGNVCPNQNGFISGETKTAQAVGG
jgi:hypothetical protein